MASVPAQLIVRTASVALLIIAITFGPRPDFRTNAPVWIVLVAAIVLVLLQLVPLPPAVWQSLPGRAFFAEAALTGSAPQPWRPLAIVPGGAVNALAALIVPLTALVLVSGLRKDERAILPAMVLGIAVATLLVGLLQFTGADLSNPLVNSAPGTVDGLFANRNHFALLMAIGCVAAPAWAFTESSGRRTTDARWRGVLALALILLFVLGILASGSRAGLLLGALATLGGLLLARRGIARDLARYPRWVTPAVLTAIVGTVMLIILASVIAGRAVSLDRALALDTAQDVRAQNLPIVLTMVRDYFPAGSGFGGFDPVFRIYEPATGLQTTYFNHAHNDLVEIVLEGGVAGLLLLGGALSWVAWASVRAWRAGTREPGTVAARMGSVILLLVVMASIVDYPARTPIIMVVVVIATACLCVRADPDALPAKGQPL